MSDVPPAIAALWGRAEPHIAEALEHCGGTHTVRDVAEAVCKGELQLWVGERCAGVTQILTFPRKRSLNLFLAGGDLEELKTLQPGVEAWARGQGCTQVKFSGRLTERARKCSGWNNVWPDYEPQWISLSKELT